MFPSRLHSPLSLGLHIGSKALEVRRACVANRTWSLCNSCSQGGEGHWEQKAEEDILSCLSASFEVQPAAALRTTSTDHRHRRSPSRLCAFLSELRLLSGLLGMRLGHLFAVESVPSHRTEATWLAPCPSAPVCGGDEGLPTLVSSGPSSPEGIGSLAG